MKKLSFEQLQDIASEIKDDMFQNNEPTELQKMIADTILSIIIRFAEKYQDRIDE